MVEYISDGDEQLPLLKVVLRAQFPFFAAAAGNGRPLNECHPVVRLRVLNSYALPMRLVRTARKLRSVAVGSGVFAQRHAALIAALQSRPSLRRV